MMKKNQSTLAICLFTVCLGILINSCKKGGNNTVTKKTVPIVSTIASFPTTLYGLAVDAVNNVYVAGFNDIYKVTPAGVVTTFAGNGVAGSSDGIGTSASFYGPTGMTIDASGYLYVCDEVNNLIRKISPAGLVSTFAGSGAKGFKNGVGTSASFYGPAAIAIDASGYLYVADNGNNLVRKISPTGTVTTIAGSGEKGVANGPAALASFTDLSGIAVDASGNVYVTDFTNGLIRKISSDGTVSTLAGSGIPQDHEGVFKNGTGAAASFDEPIGLAVDASGNILVADAANYVIRRITPAGAVTTFAGTGIELDTNGPANTASFSLVEGVAVDAAGNVYVSDSANKMLRKITL